MPCVWPFWKMCYFIRHVCGHFGKCFILDAMFVAILENVSFNTPCLWPFGKCVILDAMFVAILDKVPFQTPCLWPFWNMCYFRCHVSCHFGKCVILDAMFVVILENVSF